MATRTSLSAGLFPQKLGKRAVSGPLQAQLNIDLILANLTYSWFVVVSSSIAMFDSKMGIEHSPRVDVQIC